MVPGLGFEPRLSDSESDVLPLDDPGIAAQIVADGGVLEQISTQNLVTHHQTLDKCPGRSVHSILDDRADEGGEFVAFDRFLF